MPKILLIDHYDSFTYLLGQYFQALGAEVITINSDVINSEKAEAMKPDALVFSPGPGSVDNAKDVGHSFALFSHFRGRIPILGVCLGHQLIAKALGGQIMRTAPIHGKSKDIFIQSNSLLFYGLPSQMKVMRYHSLLVNQENFPSVLTTTALTKDGLIMAYESKKERLFGVQFHPESLGTPHGLQIIRNFLQQVNPL